MHHILVESLPPAAGEVLTVGGDEAHHALRVKRVRIGERVELLDGRGGVASGEVVEGRDLAVRITWVRHVEPVRPRVEVWSAVPKGGRADDMVDQLAQVGAAEWRPLETARGVVDPRDAKLERLARIAAEASKQCGRAWTMTIGAKVTLAEALESSGVRVVVADASGAAHTRSEVNTLRLLVGPEGGWTDEELGAAKAAGAQITRFGPHTMRIETAAVAASTLLLASCSNPT